MRTVAIIFARGGSKGLPGKNIKTLAGKPLIAWSIEHALSVSRIERVIVSTDSEEIATVARAFGAEVPFMRPAELAQDDSPEWLAWRHALDYLKNTEGVMPDVMVSLPTTAPLRTRADIEGCLDNYEEYASDVVITVSDAHRSPYFNMVTMNTDGTVRLVQQLEPPITRRQDAPRVYDIATVCYVVNTHFIMSHYGMFEGRVRAVQVPLENAIDIDTSLDFKRAEYLMNMREKKP